MGLSLRGIGHALSSVGGAIKNGVVGAGHVIGQVASNPLVEGALGLTLGPGAAALAGGLGHLMAPGGNLGEAARGAMSGYGAGTVGGTIGQLFSGGGDGASDGEGSSGAGPGGSPAPRSPVRAGSVGAPSAVSQGEAPLRSLGMAAAPTPGVSTPLYQGITSIGAPPAKSYALPRSRFDLPLQQQETA